MKKSYKISKTLFALFFFCCFVAALTLEAQTPALTVQGILKKSDGTAVPDDLYTVRFALYDASIGGTEAWVDTLNDVETIGGVYSVVLGVDKALNVTFNKDYYLGVRIGNSPQELLPRPRLTSAPTALSAFSLNGSANKIPSSGASNLGELSLSGTLKVNGFQNKTVDKFGSGSLFKDEAASFNPVKAEFVGSHTGNYSIEAEGFIQCLGVYMTSDRRAKKDFRPSNTSQDLTLLRQLQVTDYKYKDEVSNGYGWKKGFIAQEVAALIPEAISTKTEVIPDIYATAQQCQLDKQLLTLSMGKAHGLKAGDKVRLIAADKEEVSMVSTTPDAYTFTVSNWAHAKPETVFVYGREVTDFQTVDYDRLYTLNVAATQELARRIEALERENAAFKAENSNLRQLLEGIKADIQVLKGMQR